MKNEKKIKINIFYCFAILFMVISVTLAIFAHFKKYWGILDILALIFLMLAVIFSFTPLIQLHFIRKKIIDTRINQAIINPVLFIDYIFCDFKEHNVCLELDLIEKVTIQPVIDYQKEVAIYYHTLLSNSKKDLVLLDVYFSKNECLILFDEGKIYEETFPYQTNETNNYENTKDLYYTISLKIKEQYQKYINEKEALKH